jgi:hypothetical protein
MPNTRRVSPQKKDNAGGCGTIKKQLDKCVKKPLTEKNCDFYKKVLHMCMSRKKRVFMMGP